MKALFLVFALLSSGFIYAESCAELLTKILREQEEFDAGPSIEVVERLQKFADENDLLIKVLELGPESRRVQRAFVAIDMNNKDLVAKYLKTFNLDDEENPVLALEMGFEVQGEYLTGVLRTSPDPTAPIYRWGKADIPRNEWENDWLIEGGFARYRERQDNPIWGYGHLIGVTKSERDNVKHFLDNPEERGACKNSNCISWTTGIELGKTARGLDDQVRKPLFNQLGVSRSSAHFEIGRRLMHASNQKHAAAVVFVNGDKGLKAFDEDLMSFLPPDPQVPYTSIIKGLGHDPNGELMKAIATIPDGSKIYFPIAAGASPEGMSALVQSAKTLDKGYDVTILINGISETTLRKGTEIPDNKIRYSAHFMGGSMRKLHDEGKISYIPGYLSDFPRYIEDPELPDFKYDVIVVRVSPADEAGNHSLGPNHDTIMTIINSRPDIKVIAEVNENVPFTTGTNIIPKGRIFTSFKSEAQLAGPPVVPMTPIEDKIGGYLGQLVDSDSTLQIGIGNIFGGLAKGLQEHGRKGINISTEMFGDPLKDIMEMGIAEKAETGFAYGSQALYKWLHRNPNVTMVDTMTVNSPGLISETPNFHAINTALQVKLTGEINAEMGPKGRLSSPGGQVEFMSGAARSKGGKAIIAIRSTAKEKELSTITTDLYGGHTTTATESVHYVVTEYGIANLKGKSTWQKAIELVNVAHPKFRAQLKQEAIEKKIITEYQAKAIILDVPEVASLYDERGIARRIASTGYSFFEQIFLEVTNFFESLLIKRNQPSH